MIESQNKVSIGVILVSYGHVNELQKLVPAIRKQLKLHDRLVVVDNHPDQETIEAFSEDRSALTIGQDNRGFAAACNMGARSIVQDVDLLVFLNPDALPGEGMFDSIRQLDLDKYAGGMPVILLPDGTINSAGNVVHTTGVSWCDKYAQNKTAAKSVENVNVLSGACAVIVSEWWQKVGGMDEGYFMYYEDTDLSTRILQSGGKLTLLTDAYCVHDYEFDKGSYKWLYLERNIPLYILKNWPLTVIILLLPQLIFSALSFWLLAIAQKRFMLKLKSTVMMFRALPEFLQSRGATRKANILSNYDFFSTLYAGLDSPLLSPLVNNSATNYLSRLYYSVCLVILRIIRSGRKLNR